MDRAIILSLIAYLRLHFFECCNILFTFQWSLLSLLASGVLTQPLVNQSFWFLALWIAFFSILLFLMPVPYILVFFFCGVPQTWVCLEVDGKSFKISIGTLAGAFLTALTWWDGVTLDGGFGTSNSVGIAFQTSLFCVSLFINWDSSKCLEHN